MIINDNKVSFLLFGKMKINWDYLFEFKLKKKRPSFFDLFCIYLEKVQHIYGKNS